MCSIPGCEEKIHGNGLCGSHYMMWYRWGNPLYLKAHRMSPFDECTVPGCDRPHKGHGLCEGHLKRLNRRGELIDQNGDLLLNGRVKPVEGEDLDAFVRPEVEDG